MKKAVVPPKPTGKNIFEEIKKQELKAKIDVTGKAIEQMTYAEN